MGFFDKFKKKSTSAESVVDEQPLKQSLHNISYSTTENGNTLIEFCDGDADFRKFYDTTRLVVSNQPLDVNGHVIYNCNVSWYGFDDHQGFNEATGNFESPRAMDYKNVLAEIDINLLLNDSNYCEAVMKKLLDKQRVEKYLENGMQDAPAKPCGKYIGGISKTDEGYKKFFSTVVGKASHYSKQMIANRNRKKELIEANRKRMIENKKSEIARLQAELDDMEK